MLSQPSLRRWVIEKNVLEEIVRIEDEIATLRELTETLFAANAALVQKNKELQKEIYSRDAEVMEEIMDNIYSDYVPEYIPDENSRLLGEGKKRSCGCVIL